MDAVIPLKTDFSSHSVPSTIMGTTQGDTHRLLRWIIEPELHQEQSKPNESHFGPHMPYRISTDHPRNKLTSPISKRAFFPLKLSNWIAHGAIWSPISRQPGIKETVYEKQEQRIQRMDKAQRQLLYRMFQQLPILLRKRNGGSVRPFDT